ncbi:MAG TPA: GC-type dockerin domain-anchored protein [Phycisphaerales bacterium]|nr:GC-type dockerin domain-anchored protein [Phycisphaerales bacterium]
MLKASAIVLGVCVGGSALAGSVTLTELPSGTNAGNPQYTMINRSGMLAGNRQWYATFCWDASAGLMATDPSGAGVPTLSGTWIDGLNDSGQVLGNGCIPPPGGNGTCGTYLFRAQAWSGTVSTTRLDFTTLGGVFAQPGYLSDIQFSARGSVAATFNLISTYAKHPIVYTDADGWRDLSSFVPAGYNAQVMAMNAQDHVLLEIGNQMYLWTAETGAVYVPNQPTMAVGVGMNDSDEIVGWTALPTGNATFRLSPTRGYQIVAGTGQFASAFPTAINNAGMVIGNYAGGTFLYTDATGPTDLGLPSNLLGFNNRGDVLAAGHDPMTYEELPMIKLFGRPAAMVQDVVDPSLSKLKITGISAINDHGTYAVWGTRAGTTSTQAAFLVTPEHCTADFDGSGAAEVADIFAFLNAWFAGNPAADADESGSLGTADIFAFLNAWMTGC